MFVRALVVSGTWLPMVLDAQRTRPAATPTATTPAPAAVDTALFASLRWRSVGPFRGGRATAVAGIASQPHVVYMGTTGGGVWKTDDAGTHWRPLTDAAFDVGNVGAIDVADSDPKVIYVGTGSASIRGNSSVGRGVYKSTDGGETWRFVGLRETGAIGELVIHPTDPNTVWLAAVGHPFGKNRERGVFRTRDGGATWEHVLALDDSTGAVAIALHPTDPSTLYAGAWRAERKPWTMLSGGPKGGVYRSTDGGTTWTKLAGGLPQGLVGKVGLATTPAKPDRVWALVEAPDTLGGLYLSDDRGATWTRRSRSEAITGRPFYYTHVVADPVNADVVYSLNVRLQKSVDAGKSFTVVPVPHGDTHDLWINPVDPSIMALSDDGGTVVTLNGGRTWSSMYNQPTAELYDVVVDNAHPYRLYGSQQDNTAISVLSRRLHNSLRPQQEWGYGAGCETGPVALHPDHPETIWGGCYGGAINRYHVPSDTRTSIVRSPASTNVAARDMADRFQWVAPIVVSPHDPRTLFHASQYLYRSRDGGDTWARISPDLTTNDTTYQRWPGGPITPDHTGVEVFTTIFAVTPSPHDARTIWVGTDDGRVQLTTDDGATWRDITPKGMPKRGTVNRLEVSPHAPGRALIAVQRYREDDFAPYVFRTDDFGATWVRLTDGRNGIPADHPVRVVREDPVVRGVLYAGTEFGIFVSLDDGRTWLPLRRNLPATPVTDIKVQRGDLAISTQGRSFWVLDDLSPLRELALEARAGAIADRTLRLFTPRPAARGVVGDALQEVDFVQPDDLPHGALVQLVLATPVSSLAVEVLDAQGTVLATLRPERSAPTGRDSTTGTAVAPGGMRAFWDLRGAPAHLAAGGRAVKMPPGSYRVRAIAGADTVVRPLVVIGNPAAPTITQADYEASYALASAVRDTMRAMNRLLASLRTTQAQLAAQRDSARAAGRDAEVQALEVRLADHARIVAMLVPPRATGPASAARLVAQYGTLYNALTGDGGYGAGSAEGRPPVGWAQRADELAREWAAVRAAAQALATPVVP
jgi:photosystem II stability/assembly factor-like uncharacterized protein